jgi:hypothetical protein
MTTEYRVFSLSPGQKPPTGATGVTISGTGDIVWVGEDGTFNESAEFGTILGTDPTPESTITHRAATQDEIDEYLAAIS